MKFNARAQGRKGVSGMILKSRRGGIAILPLSVVLALLLVALAALDARADGGTSSFAGRGSGTYEVTNPEDCAETGICKGELRGDFNAAGSDLSAAGEVAFNFVDDRSARGCAVRRLQRGGARPAHLRLDGGGRQPPDYVADLGVYVSVGERRSGLLEALFAH